MGNGEKREWLRSENIKLSHRHDRLKILQLFPSVRFFYMFVSSHKPIHVAHMLPERSYFS